MIGQRVEIRSAGGISYHGVVRDIRPTDDGGEVFELGSNDDPLYCRYVYVTDRERQIDDLRDE